MTFNAEYEHHYINGKLIDYRRRGTTDNEQAPTVVDTTTNPVLLAVNMYDAILDECILFDNALNGNEIIQIYHSFVELNTLYNSVSSSKQDVILSISETPEYEHPSPTLDLAKIDLSLVTQGHLELGFATQDQNYN